MSAKLIFIVHLLISTYRDYPRTSTRTRVHCDSASPSNQFLLQQGWSHWYFVTKNWYEGTGVSKYYIFFIITVYDNSGPL